MGHAGTLDPAATGLLIVVFGNCTSDSEKFMGLGKRYRGVVKLGVTTDTDDLDGQVTGETEVRWNVTEIENAVQQFQGEILQAPPSVSAIKIDGKRSYKRARKGEEVKHAPRPVEIEEIRIVELDNPFVTLDIRCSKGTYIRSIARDLGRELGCGGTLASLRRTEIGPYSVDDAWEIGEVLMHPEFRGQ